MASKPLNEKLWNTIILMAKGKFRVWPSPAAAHWVHQSYVEKGGQFADSDKKKAALTRQHAQQKAAEKQSRS